MFIFLELQGGSGYAKNIVFQNVVMRNVTNPIIINQSYCDQDNPCPEQVIHMTPSPLNTIIP